MNQLMRALAMVVMLATVSAAQVVPDQYVVELSEEPLGAAVRTKAKAALSDRHRPILSEQARAKSAIEASRGRVLSSVDSLMNALIVHAPDAAALSAIPGVKAVYPVTLAHATLDHALALHQIPTAWNSIGGRDKAGAGVKIAILDTGISPDHPGFQDPTLKFPAGYPRASSAKNLTLTNTKIIVARSYGDIYDLPEPDDARDHEGHGTAVAMCAAGVTNRGPLATITGVAPKAWIGGYKITRVNGSSASSAVILKALDDALADGMDVINLSYGSPVQFSTGPDFLPGVALERLKSYGVLVVVAAGNSGPGLNTMSNYASQPSVISVGATENDREFGENAVVSGTNYRAYAGTGPTPASTISGNLLDASNLDPTGFLCSPIADGSAAGQVILILRGVCTFDIKLESAKAAGAVAAIIYTDAARPDAFNPSVGTATLPTVLVSFSDGVAIKAAVANAPGVPATLSFKPVTYARESRLLSSFSSKGPTWEYRIKPDLSAAGANIYTAAQTLDDKGEDYSKDGYQILQGPSFSAPIVAGAAAVLRAARPGLTVDQYSSLLINGATLLFSNGGPAALGVQRTGTGILNLESALRNTVTLYPTAITFLTGTGALDDYNQVSVTNIGRATDTFRIRSIPYDSAPPLGFSAITPGTGLLDPKPEATYTLTLDPGQTKTIYAYWKAQLSPGEYQGQILVEGSTTSVLMPYWHGVPTLVPREVLELTKVPTSALASTVVNLSVRVTDDVGFPLTTDAQLRFSGTATAGSSISLQPGVVFPNRRTLRLTLAPTVRSNTFQFIFGNLPPIIHTINGTANP